MLQPYATDELLEGVKRDCFLATSDENWSDSRILGVAHDQIIGEIAGRLKNTKQNWFESRGSITLSTTKVAYDLPEEAMFGSVESIHLRDRSTGNIVNKLILAQPSQIGMYQSDNPTIPVAFFLDQTQIVLPNLPDSTSVSTYDLQVSYYRRPCKLVLLTDVCTATVIAAQSITTTTQPTYFTTNAPDPYTSGTPSRVDVWNRLTPYTRKLANATCSLNSGTSITFNGSVTTAQVNTISAGDIVSVHGTTIFPDLPPEVMPLLRRFVAREIKMAQGAADYQRYADRLDKDWANVLRGLGKRTDGTPTKLSLYNAGAAQTISMRRWRRG